MTTYEVVAIRTIDVVKADLETLSALFSLTDKPVRKVSPSGVMPGSHTRHIRCVEEAFDGLVGMDALRELFGRLTIAHAIFDFLRITDGSRRYVYMDEVDIIARFVGSTTPKVRQVVESGLDGAVYIDEFHSFANLELATATRSSPTSLNPWPNDADSIRTAATPVACVDNLKGV